MVAPPYSVILLHNTVSKNDSSLRLVAVFLAVKTIDGANIDVACGLESEIDCCIEFQWATFVQACSCYDCCYSSALTNIQLGVM